MPSKKDFTNLYCDIEDACFEEMTTEDYQISLFIARDPHKQTANEDAMCLLQKNGLLFVSVADGAGGHPKGREASMSAVKALAKSAEGGMLANPPELIEKANQEVLDLKAGAKTTLVMSWIDQGVFRAGAVGDSEVVYWNSLGTELYSNVPHSTVGYQVEAGVLDEEEALDASDRYSVDNLLGDRIIRMEFSSGIQMKRGHCFVLGSDGLFDNFTHTQLADYFLTGKIVELSELCKTQSGDDWKKSDDLSFVFVRKL